MLNRKDGWKQYVFEKDKFEIDFPSKPHIEHKPGGLPSTGTTFYTSNASDGNRCIVIVNTIAQIFGSEEDFSELIINNLAKQLDGTPEIGDYEFGNDAYIRTFLIQLNNGRKLQGIASIVKNTTYILAIESSADIKNQYRFIKSFSYTGQTDNP